MSRKSLYICVTCLLYLLPALSFAQSLTLYEYWFDDDFDNRISSSLSGANAVVNTSIDVNQLDNGIHKFSFRAKQSDGKFSAVSSSLFLKRPAAQGSQVEYWFDDNFDQRDKIDILNTEDEQELSLDLRSSTKYPMGFHKLNMRVTLEGEGESAIYSSDVVKLSAGKATRLEYWIDDDIAHSQTIEGKPSTDGTRYQFLTDLDFSGVSPGYHRLNCRSVSTSKRTSGAISMTPIMVKPKDYSAEGLTMESYSFSVDDKTPVEIPIVNKKEGVNIPYSLDARNLSLGEHKLKASFKNSLGISTMIEELFTVVPQEDPSINLTTWDDDGYLTMEFNTIPNDVSYTVMEKWNDDIQDKIVWKRVASFHPNTIKAIPDTWYTGNTSYYVKATYIDSFGNEKEVISNEVTPQKWVSPEETYGCIVGRVDFSDKDNNSLLPPHKHIKVKFFDGKEEKEEILNSNGTFSHDNIPFGSTLNVSIDDDDYYHYESITVNVDNSTRNQTCVIHATAHDDVAMNVSNDNCDMMVTRYERRGSRVFEFTLRNNTYYTWSGIFEIIAFKKDKSDDVTFNSSRPFFHVGSAYIDKLNSGDSRDISITLENFPKLKDDENYIFYYVTQKEDMSTTKQYKQVVFQDNERFRNPMMVLMYPDPEIDGTAYKDMDEFITAVLKIMKECDTWNGPLSKAAMSIPDKVVQSEWKKKDDAFLYTMPAILLSFTNDLKKNYKSISKETKPIRDFYNEIKDAYDITLNEDKSPFDRFLKVSKNIFKAYGKYSGDPFAQLYCLYLDVADQAVDKIMDYQKAVIMPMIDDKFIQDYITFNIKVIKKKSILKKVYHDAHLVADRIRLVEVNMETNTGVPIMATYDVYGEEGSDNVILHRKNINQNQVGGESIKRFWMKIYWENGRVSLVPLYDAFVDWVNNGVDNINITVTFKSETAYPIEDKIYLDY